MDGVICAVFLVLIIFVAKIAMEKCVMQKGVADCETRNFLITF